MITVLAASSRDLFLEPEMSQAPEIKFHSLPLYWAGDGNLKDGYVQTWQIKAKLLQDETKLEVSDKVSFSVVWVSQTLTYFTIKY